MIMNFAIVTHDREQLRNVVEIGRFNHNRSKALAFAKKMTYEYNRIFDKKYVVIEVPHSEVSSSNHINNKDGFHKYTEV